MKDMQLAHATLTTLIIECLLEFSFIGHISQLCKEEARTNQVKWNGIGHKIQGAQRLMPLKGHQDDDKMSNSLE
jgi:hypothetical protein